MRIRGLRLHISQIDNGAVVSHERCGQGQNGVSHPEALLGYLLKNKKHAFRLGHFFAEHQSGLALLRGQGQLGINLVHADAQRGALKFELGLVLGNRRGPKAKTEHTWQYAAGQKSSEIDHGPHDKGSAVFTTLHTKKCPRRAGIFD